MTVLKSKEFAEIVTSIVKYSEIAMTILDERCFCFNLAYNLFF